MLPKEELIAKLAPHYQAFLKTRTSEFTAWASTLAQFDDLKFLLKPEEDFAKKKLHSEVKHFIKEIERKEKERLTKPSWPENITTKKPNVEKSKSHWHSIEDGLPPENDRIITIDRNAEDKEEPKHEPDPHSESFLEDNTKIKYVSKETLREKLNKEHEDDIKKRWGPALK